MVMMRAVGGFLMDRLADFPHPARRGLGDEPDFLDHFHERPRRTIADRRFVGIHLDQRVVHAHAGEGGDDVFDGVDLHRALGQGGGALDGLHLVHIGIDERLVGQIDAAELETVAFRGGFERERDLLPGVERGALERGRTGEGVLDGGGHGRAGLVFSSRGASRNALRGKGGIRIQ